MNPAVNPICRFLSVCFLTALCLLSPLAHGQSLTVIDLKHRTADEVLPALRPLVGGTAALSGVDYRLLVRASDEDVARIRDALTVLDRAPKQMLVSVRYATQTQIEREHVSVSGQLSTGGSQVTVRAGRDGDARDGTNISSVRVMEGQAAYIASGERVPMVTAAYISPRSAGAVIEERPVQTGFQVTPRINGDRVFVEVGAQQEQLRSGNNVTTQRIGTTIAGKTGEWLALGGVSESVNSRSSTIGGRRIQTASDDRQMWIKVDPIVE